MQIVLINKTYFMTLILNIMRELNIGRVNYTLYDLTIICETISLLKDRKLVFGMGKVS